MSIQPKWCEFIADERKTVEVRKNRPKLETPFKVYIYCTKDKYCFPVPDVTQGKVIGEFICELIEKFRYNRNGYRLEKEKALCIDANLDEKRLYNYLQSATPYAWYISRLIIYDTPKELSEFGKTRPPQSWCYVEETK